MPHRTLPTVGHPANIYVQATIMHLAKPVELADSRERRASLFVNPSDPKNGRFELPSAPGLGAEFDAVEMGRRRLIVKV